MQIPTIKKELLKCIRGQKSQTQINRKLGFGFNQIYRWESGLVRISWGDFVKLCDACKVDLKNALQKTVKFSDEKIDGTSLVKALIGSDKITKIAKEVKISRFILSDWIKGHSEPPLEGILKLLAHQDLLMYFIESLIDIKDSELFNKIASDKKSGLNFFYENPPASAVLMCLELKSYQNLSKHSSQFISQKAQMVEADVDKYLQQMLQLNLINLENGKYNKNAAKFNTKGDFEGDKQLRSYWVHKGLQFDRKRLQITEDSSFGYMLVSADKKKIAKMKEAYLQALQAFYSFGDDSHSDDDELTILTFQMFPLKDPNI